MFGLVRVRGGVYKKERDSRSLPNWIGALALDFGRGILIGFDEEGSDWDLSFSVRMLADMNSFVFLFLMIVEEDFVDLRYSVQKGVELITYLHFPTKVHLLTCDTRTLNLPLLLSSLLRQPSTNGCLNMRVVDNPLLAWGVSYCTSAVHLGNGERGVVELGCVIFSGGHIKLQEGNENELIAVQCNSGPT